MKHKHAAEIIAWANGATIEVRVPKGKWMVSHSPYWHVDHEYRVKPKPDVVRYFNVSNNCFLGNTHTSKESAAMSNFNESQAGVVRMTIDGETGKLSAEVVE